MAHLHIQNLSFTYPAEETPCLQTIDLTVQKGEYLVICGRSGSGKSTLLRHLKPVLTPHGIRSGDVLLDGTPLTALTPAQQASCIGFVMQDPEEQIVTDKVWHELAFGLESMGTPQQVMAARVAEMACYFGIQDWFDKDIATMSGGQKQLLNLASIMAMQPQVLVLDEPTSQLDPIAASDFLNTVRKINRELGTTVIITEHRLEDILPYADRAVVLDGGRIIACDTPRQVCAQLAASDDPMFTAMPTPARVYFSCKETGECPLTLREGRNWLTRAFPEAPTVVTLPAAPEYHSTAPAVSMQELWLRYEKDSPDVLRGVSGEIPQGSIYAIVGGNGAGKSTLLKAICGIRPAYRGKLQIFGKPIRTYKAGTLYQNCLAMLPQDPKSLFVKNTVAEDLREMCKNGEEIARIAAFCQIEALLGKHPFDLSGGELQRAALAKVLLTDPNILLLDEPTKGMDCFFKQTFGQILRQLQATGVTVVLVSHDVEFCAQYADLVSMFFNGQLVTTQAPRSFFGGNSFYTTAANRMSRFVFRDAVCAEDVVQLYRSNKEA